MKLNEIAKALKGFKTDIGFIYIGSKLIYTQTSAFKYGLVTKIKLKEKKAFIVFYEDKNRVGLKQESTSFWFDKGDLKSAFEVE
jgi:hypothetical protein